MIGQFLLIPSLASSCNCNLHSSRATHPCRVCIFFCPLHLLSHSIQNTLPSRVSLRQAAYRKNKLLSIQRIHHPITSHVSYHECIRLRLLTLYRVCPHQLLSLIDAAYLFSGLLSQSIA